MDSSHRKPRSDKRYGMVVPGNAKFNSSTAPTQPQQSYGAMNFAGRGQYPMDDLSVAGPSPFPRPYYTHPPSHTFHISREPDLSPYSTFNPSNSGPEAAGPALNHYHGSVSNANASASRNAPTPVRGPAQPDPDVFRPPSPTAVTKDIASTPGPTESRQEESDPSAWDALRDLFTSGGGPKGIPPTHTYADTGRFTGLDCLRRRYRGKNRDCYISCTSGKFKPLVVQCTGLVLEETQRSVNGGSTWHRRPIRSVGSLHLRVASWALSHVSDFEAPLDEWEWRSWAGIVKYFASLVPLLLVGPFISRVPDLQPDSTRFDQFPYAHFTCAKSYRNSVEDNLTPMEQSIPTNATEPGNSHSLPSNQASGKSLSELLSRPLDPQDPLTNLTHEIEENGIMKRVLSPRLLYSLEKEETVNLKTTKIEKCPRYIFVAYTDAHFPGQRGKEILHSIATRAAHDACCSWYWSSAKCVNSRDLNAQDVFNISDVLRGAQCLVIALPEDNGWSNKEDETMDRLLKEWSDRIWTFPELLISPGKMVQIYFPSSRGSNEYRKREKEKHEFLQGPLSDSPTSRQLLDHYGGSMVLSNLELIGVALQCFSTRRTKSQYMSGDYSYALMGLLRRRPEADATDSPFLAFARLSLANYTEQLLERRICILDKFPSNPWHCMDDGYGAMLWDIIPTINIAAIGVYRSQYPEVTVPPSFQHHEIDHDNDIVIVDGCRAATIHWDAFQPVAQRRNASWKRIMARLLLRFTIVPLIAGAICVSYKDKKTQTAGIVLLIYSILITLMFPVLVIKLYMGKLWDTQPWLFGFEGYCDIREIEKLIFGAPFNRLHWSFAGSPLSQYAVDDKGVIKTLDPCTLDQTSKEVHEAAGSKPHAQKMFTLIDTVSMTVTLFKAERPPIALLLCGTEGGMQRAIGCSLDWTTGTLYKETVLRVPTELVSRMAQIPRVKLGIRRRDLSVVENPKYNRGKIRPTNSSVVRRRAVGSSPV